MRANDRVVVSIMGLNGRGRRVGPNFAVQQNCNVKYACDVDSQVAQRFLGEFDEVKKKHPKLQEDFRKTLEDKEVDALGSVTK
jgi:hypothetical protein